MKRSRVKVKAVVILFLVFFVEAVENDAESTEDTTQTNLSFRSENDGKLFKKLKLYTFKPDDNVVEKEGIQSDMVNAVKSSASLMNQFIGNKNYVIMPVESDKIPVQVIVDRVPKNNGRPNSRIVKIRKLPRNDAKESTIVKEEVSTEAESDVTEAYVSDDENVNKSKRVRTEVSSSVRGKLKYTDSEESLSSESDNYPDIEKFRKRVEEVTGRRFQSHSMPKVPVRDDGIIPPVVRQLLAQIVMKNNVVNATEKVKEKKGSLEYSVTRGQENEDENGLVGAHSGAAVLAGKSNAKANLDAISQKNSNGVDEKANATYAQNNLRNFRLRPRTNAANESQVKQDDSDADNARYKNLNARNNLFRKNKQESRVESDKDKEGDLNDNKTSISDANESENSSARTPLKINNDELGGDQRRTGFRNNFNQSGRVNVKSDPGRTSALNNARNNLRPRPSTENSGEERVNSNESGNNLNLNKNDFGKTNSLISARNNVRPTPANENTGAEVSSKESSLNLNNERTINSNNESGKVGPLIKTRNNLRGRPSIENSGKEEANLTESKNIVNPNERRINAKNEPVKTNPLTSVRNNLKPSSLNQNSRNEEVILDESKNIVNPNDERKVSVKNEPARINPFNNARNNLRSTPSYENSGKEEVNLNDSKIILNSNDQRRISVKNEPARTNPLTSARNNLQPTPSNENNQKEDVNLNESKNIVNQNNERTVSAKNEPARINYINGRNNLRPTPSNENSRKEDVNLNESRNNFNSNEQRRINVQNQSGRINPSNNARNNLRPRPSNENNEEEKTNSNETTERSNNGRPLSRGTKKFVPTKYETFSSFISDSLSKDNYRQDYSGEYSSGRYNPELDLARGNLRYSDLSDLSSGENGNYRAEPSQGQQSGDYNNQSFRTNRTRLNIGGRISNAKNDANKQPVVATDTKTKSDDSDQSTGGGNRKYQNSINIKNPGGRITSDANYRNDNKQSPSFAGGQENQRGTGLVHSNSKYNSKDENESDVSGASGKNTDDDNKDILISTVKPSNLNTNQPNYKGVIGLRKHNGETAIGRDDQSNNNKFGGSKISFGSSVGTGRDSESKKFAESKGPGINETQNGSQDKNSGENLRFNLGVNRGQGGDLSGRNQDDGSNSVIDRNRNPSNFGRQNTGRPLTNTGSGSNVESNGNDTSFGSNNGKYNNGRPGLGANLNAGRQNTGGAGLSATAPNRGESGKTRLSQDDGRDSSRGQESNANKFNPGRNNAGVDGGKSSFGGIGENQDGSGQGQTPSTYRLNLTTSFGVDKNNAGTTESSTPRIVAVNQSGQQGIGFGSSRGQVDDFNKYSLGTNVGSGRFGAGSLRATEKPLSIVLEANKNGNEQAIGLNGRKAQQNNFNEPQITRTSNNEQFSSNSRDYSTNGNRNSNTNTQYSNNESKTPTPSTPPPRPPPLKDLINSFYNDKSNTSLPFVQTSQFSFSEVTNFVPEYDDRPLNSSDATTNNTDNSVNSGTKYNNGQSSGNQNSRTNNNGNESPPRQADTKQKNVIPSANLGPSNAGLNNDKQNVQNNFGRVNTGTQYVTQQNNASQKSKETNSFSSLNGKSNQNINGNPSSFRQGESTLNNNVPSISTNPFNSGVVNTRTKSQINQQNNSQFLNENKSTGGTLTLTSQRGSNQNNDFSAFGGRKANGDNKNNGSEIDVDGKIPDQVAVKPITNGNSNFFSFLNGNTNKNKNSAASSTPKPERSTPTKDLLTSSTEKIETKINYNRPNTQNSAKITTGKSNDTAKKYPYELDDGLNDFIYNASFLSVNGGSSKGIDTATNFSSVLGKKLVASPPDITQKRVSTAFDDKEKNKAENAKKANGELNSSLNRGDSKSNTGNLSSSGQTQSSIKNGIQLTSTQDSRAGLNGPTPQGAPTPKQNNANNGGDFFSFLSGNNPRVPIDSNASPSLASKKPDSEGPSSRILPQSNLSTLGNKNPISTRRLNDASKNQNNGGRPLIKSDSSRTASSQEDEPESSKEDFRVGSDSQNYNLGVLSEANLADNDDGKTSKFVPKQIEKKPVETLKISQDSPPRQTVDVTSNLNDDGDLGILGNGKPFQQNRIAAKQNFDYAPRNDKSKINMKNADDANDLDKNTQDDYVNYSTPKPDLANEKDSRKDPEILNTSENTHGVIGQQFANRKQPTYNVGKFTLENRRRPQTEGSNSRDEYDLKSDVHVGGQRYEQNFESRGGKRLPAGPYEKQDPSSSDRGSIKYKFDPFIYEGVDSAHFPSEFGYQFDTPNGISTYQRATLKKLDDHMIYVVKGSYQYTAPDGTVVNVVYTADENGYHPQIISPDLSSTNYEAPKSSVNEEQQIIDDNLTPIANDE